MLRYASLLLCLFIASRPTAAQPNGTSDVVLYHVDTQHSLLDFTARHLGFGRVRGTFNTYDAAAAVDPEDFSRSVFRVVVQVASLDTQNPGRDDLLTDQFFGASGFPLMTFESTRIARAGDGWTMAGDLTIRDVTRQVDIPFTIQSLGVRDQWENLRMVLEGSLTIDRNDFGVAYADNDFWDSIVSDDIVIDISLGFENYNALNSIFPWRRSQISRYIRDRVDSMSWEALADSVRIIDTTPGHAITVSTDDLYRVSRAFMQQGRHADAAQAIALSLERIEASGDLPPDAAAPFHLLAAENARRAGEDPEQHLRAAARVAPDHPLLFVMERAWR